MCLKICDPNIGFLSKIVIVLSSFPVLWIFVIPCIIKSLYLQMISSNLVEEQCVERILVFVVWMDQE